MPIQSIITYDGLPISSGGGHAVRSRSPMGAWDEVTKFMTACTDNPAPLDVSIELVTGDTIPSEFSAPLLTQLTKDYGPSKPHGLGSDTGHIWPVTADKIAGLVEMVEQLRPLPVHPYKLQPISVNVLFQFRLLSPQSGEPLPNQEAHYYDNLAAGYAQLLGVSQLYVRLSERSTVSLFLNFPFEDITDPFQELARHVQRNLPFKLSKFHWKMWRLAKNGKRYVGRKIPPPVAVG